MKIILNFTGGLWISKESILTLEIFFSRSQSSGCWFWFLKPLFNNRLITVPLILFHRSFFALLLVIKMVKLLLEHLRILYWYTLRSNFRSFPFLWVRNFLKVLLGKDLLQTKLFWLWPLVDLSWRNFSLLYHEIWRQSILFRLKSLVGRKRWRIVIAEFQRPRNLQRFERRIAFCGRLNNWERRRYFIL